jgi:hypothetical protein
MLSVWCHYRRPYLNPVPHKTQWRSTLCYHIGTSYAAFFSVLPLSVISFSVCFFCLLFIFIYTYCIHKHTYIIFLAVLGFEFRLVLARQAHYILSHTFNLFYYSHFGDRILLLSAQASLPCDLCFFFFFSFFKAALGPHAC